ncbi:hypothetical protein [Streptomyces microflavus]|uniref:hypothetical protein n=1 Tax=Streptomyces microflavus TaxID=1919 RepID=UPI0036CAFE41
MLQQQGGDRIRNGRGRFTEPRQHGFAVADDVVDAEPDDAANGLGVEEHDDSGDTEPHRYLGIGQ